MTRLILVLTSGLLATTACRDRTDNPDRSRFGKTAETANDDFTQARNAFEAHARERLSRIDARIRELESRGEAKGREMIPELRAKRDEAARELDEIGRETKAGWDRFESDVSRRFDEIDRNLDARL